jgi:outer membrane beta-barrel protein
MKNILALCLLVTILGLSRNVRAEVVEFPEDQLARESVVPLFDQPAAVKKRYVPLGGRVEVGVFAGTTLSDTFFSSYPFGLNVNYHFSDFHAVNVAGAYFYSQQASYIGQLTQQISGTPIPFSIAPNPQYMGLLEYEFTPYYGKISLTKQKIMNLTISATAGVGYMGLNSESTPMGAAGLNQKFFFTRSFGLQAALRALFYQQTDVVPSGPFVKTNVTNIVLTAGVIYLLPSL